MNDGCVVGIEVLVGGTVGEAVGVTEGTSVGMEDGMNDGCVVGIEVLVGGTVGETVRVGNLDGDGEFVPHIVTSGLST